jgi:RNA polymerase sigma factor (TIGR02999 family)
MDEVRRLYEELRAIAASVLSSHQATRNHATSLVHQAVVKMTAWNRGAGFESDGHLLAVAAKAMRHVMVDRARAANAQKRSADGERVGLETLCAPREGAAINVIDLNDALEDLAAGHERCGQVVELRFFAGLTVEETAQVLGVGVTAAESDWRFARSWLTKRLKAYDPAETD